MALCVAAPTFLVEAPEVAAAECVTVAGQTVCKPPIGPPPDIPPDDIPPDLDDIPGLGHCEHINTGDYQTEICIPEGPPPPPTVVPPDPTTIPPPGQCGWVNLGTAGTRYVCVPALPEGIPLPGNQAPTTPLQIDPVVSRHFAVGEAQIFTIRADDPEDHPYTGHIIVRDLDGSQLTTFPLPAARSGATTTGSPPGPLPPGAYTWVAQAIDAAGAVSAASAPRAFSVDSLPPAGSTHRVSVDTRSGQAKGSSKFPSISADGRYVAFESAAPDLVPGDSNGKDDIFVRDRATGSTTRVSVNTSGAQATGNSWYPSISGDGRYVAFESEASNLVSGDTNGKWDIFVHDRATAATSRISLTNSGAQATGDSYKASISGDGRYISFESPSSSFVTGDNNGKYDIFVRDMVALTTTRASVQASGAQANGDSTWSSISGDGRYLAFGSSATDLVSGDTNTKNDVFVRDRVGNTTTRVSVPASGQSNGFSGSPSISGNGNFVAFKSAASNLVSGDTNAAEDIFVRDRGGAVTTRESVDAAGLEAQGNSRWPSISSDGRFVVFESFAPNLAPGDGNQDSDVFIRDRTNKLTTMASVSSAGTGSARSSGGPGISSGGRYVAFHSAGRLVNEDSNDTDDVFTYDRDPAKACGASFPAVPTPAGCIYGDLAKAKSDRIGLEDFYPYERFDTGTGSAFVNMATGNLALQHTDLEVPGQGLNLRLTRTYNSQADAVEGSLGKGWTLGVVDGDGLIDGLLSAIGAMDINRIIEFLGAEDQFDFYDSDGTRHHFVKGGTSGLGWHSPPGVSLTMTDGVDSQMRRFYTLVRPDGVFYEFRPLLLDYRLTKIGDRTGNYLNFNYSNGKLQTITDTLGRTFTLTWSGNYVTKVRFTSGTNFLDTNFAYTGNRLTSVTEAAGTTAARTTSYAYNASGLTTTTDPRGASTAFAIDAGRLTRITDRTGKAWNFAYGGTCVAPVGWDGTAACLTDPEGNTSIWTTTPEANLIHRRDAGEADESGSPRRNDRSYVWKDNRLVKETDESANSTEYGYDHLGLITQVKAEGSGDPTAVSLLSYKYPGAGLGELTDMKSAAGTADERVLRFTYDDIGQLRTVRDPFGVDTYFGYHGRGLLMVVSDQNGHNTNYGDGGAPDWGYDPSGQPKKIRDATAAYKTLAYDYLGRNTQVTDRAGKVWNMEYDLRGNLTKKITPLGDDSWFCYDLNDNQILSVSPRSAAPSCSLDGTDGYSTKKTYDSLDLLSTVVTKSDTQLRKSTFNYYEDGQLKEIYEPRSFDASGNLIADPFQHQRAQYLRYPNNRVRAFIDEEGNQTDVVYTPNGLPRTVTEPSSGLGRHPTTYTYNSRDQVKTVLEPGHSQPSTHNYNLHGEKTSTKSPKGATTTFEYDKGGRLVRTIDAHGRSSNRTYDMVGNLLTLSQPKDVGGQLTTNYAYTRRNEIASESDPADPAHQVDYTYDAEGRQRFRYDKYNGATERTVEQIYRDDGRMTERIASGPGLSTHRTTFGYDASGNPTSASTYFDGSATPNVSSITAAYTSAEELKTWTETIYPPSGGGVTKTSSFAYERDGLLTDRSVDGNQTTYLHHKNAWEKNSTPWGGLGTLTSEYHPNGAVRKITMPNGATVDQTFDPADRLSSRVVKKTDGSVLSSWEQILYDDSDNRTSEQVSQRQTDNTTVLTGAATYGYDRLDRLTSAKHPFENNAVPYTLDDAGNIVAETDFRYSYSNNRLASRTPITDPVTTPFTYGYDHFGNQIAETEGAETTSTNYDAASHTKRVTSPDGSWVEYRYDGLDRMVRRQDSAGEVRLFFHNASSDQITLETDGTGAAKTHYLLDSSGDPVANDVPGTGRGYYVEDSRGDLNQLIDQSQNVKAVFGYDAFGKEKPALTNLASGWDSRLRFQMAPKDPKTGAYSLGPRLLSPQINRFVGADMYVAAAANLGLQADPLTGNRYLYAGANPAGMIDDGHAPRWLRKAWKWVKKNKWQIAAGIGAGLACIGSAGIACAVIAGAAAGAAVSTGKYLTSGKKVTVKGALKAAGVGAITGAIGGALGFGAGKVLGAVAKSVRAGPSAAPRSVVGAACSFSAATAVVMADGTRKAISGIDVGDYVLAEDPQSGERGPRRVTHLWEHDDTVVDLEIDGDVVTTTEDHPFWNATDREWQEAQDLDTGDLVRTADGELVEVGGLRVRTARTTTAFNLTVDGIHTYFVAVGEDDVLVHNTCGPGLDALSASGQKVIGNQGMTKAGASLAQHGDDLGFGAADLAGGPKNLNALGQDLLDDILTHPGARMETVTSGHFKGGTRFVLPDGAGATFDANGAFRYFGLHG